MNKRMIVIFSILAVFVLSLLIVGSIFTIKTIQVEYVYTHPQDVTTSDSDIINGSKALGSNILFANENNIKTNVETSNPYCKVINVERFFPSSVTLYIKQRIAVAGIRVQDTSSILLIDDEGVALEVIDEESIAVNIVEGLSVDNVALGYTVSSADGKTQKLLSVLNAFTVFGYKDSILLSTLDSVVFDGNSCVLTMVSGVKFIFNPAINVFDQVKSFLNFYGTEATEKQRSTGFMTIDNVYHQSSGLYGIYYWEE